MDPLSVLDVGARSQGDDVAEPHPQVVPHHAVHPDLLVLRGVVAQDNAGRLLPLLPLNCTRLQDLRFEHEIGADSDQVP